MVVQEEPDERRRSSPVLREPEGEVPSGYLTLDILHLTIWGRQCIESSEPYFRSDTKTESE